MDTILADTVAGFKMTLPDEYVEANLLIGDSGTWHWADLF